MNGEPSPGPCQQCGMPITSVRVCKSKRRGLCSKCFKRLYDKEYRETHKERYKRYAQKYFTSNRDKLRDKNTAQKRVWRDANRLHYREYQRNYKRRMRSDGGYLWGELPVVCDRCGEDISDRWGTKSRREGLCPRCYRRKAQTQYYHAVKIRKSTSSAPDRTTAAISRPLNRVGAGPSPVD